MELSTRPAGAARDFPLPPNDTPSSGLFFEWKERARSGDFRGAWRVSDRALEINHRRDLSGLPEHLRPLWNGERSDGKSVLVRCFHGLGDTIQFARFIPRLAEIAADVEVRVQPSLVPLLRPGPGNVRIVSRNEPEDYDSEVEIEIMELGHAFRIDLETIPSAVPYVSTSTIPVISDARVKVGLVWQAGDWDDRRSIPFDALEPWSWIPGVEFFSLQFDPSSAGWKSDFGRELDAWTVERTAGLMNSLDLVISVDTMAAHLAGALGRPVWTLLQADADWRWMERRSDSPWYPTMRLFRQEKEGEWDSVVAAVGVELLKLIEEKDGGGDRNRTDE